jgi:hypothetical protein
MQTRGFFLSLSSTVRVFAPSHYVKINMWDGPRAGTYIYISPTESKQGQIDGHWPNNCFFYWTKSKRKPTFIGCSFHSQERKEKGQKGRKIEVNEHEHTLHLFFFFADRRTHSYQNWTHEHVTDLYDQTETVDIPTQIKTKILEK